MKFNKSHIFLISLISIFLLLSLSAVSASDNMDNQLSDSSSDLLIDDVNEIADANDKNLINSHMLSDGGSAGSSEKISTVTESSDVEAKYNGSVNIDIKVKDNESKDINISKNDIKLLKGEIEHNFTYENNTITLKDSLEIGVYDFIVKYLGNDAYAGSQANVKLTILENNNFKVNDTINVNSHNKTIVIPIELKDSSNKKIVLNKEDLKVIYEYYSASQKKTISNEITDYALNDSAISFEKDDLNKAKVTITYKDGTFNKTQAVVKINEYLNAEIIPINVKADFQDGNFTFKLVDADTGDILPNTTITVRGVNFYKYINGTSITPSKNFQSDENGIIFIENINLNSGYDMSSFVYNFTSLAAGKYNLTFLNSNSSLVLNNVTEITVNPIKVKIIAQDYNQYVGSDIKYTFTVVNEKTNNVVKLLPMQFKVKISSNYTTYNTTTNTSGQSSFNINLVAGNYPVVIVTNSSNVDKTSVQRNITLNKRPGVLTANNRTIYYGSAATAIIRFTDKATGKAVENGIVKVRLYTTSNKYVNLTFLTNKTGYVVFNAALAVGKHKMIISCADYSYYASSITRYVTVLKTSGKFSAPYLSTYYGSGKTYTIKLTNAKNNHPMYGANVNVKVFVSSNRFYNYTATTDGNGQINLKLSYKPGTYRVVVTNIDKGFTAKSVTGQIKLSKHPLKYSLNSLTIKKGNVLKVKAISANSKKALSGVKVKITIYTGKKYQTYTVRTDSKGIASLKIAQRVGKHNFVISPAATIYYSGQRSGTLTVTK